MPKARAKAELIVPTDAGGVRESLVEALAEDLRAASADATEADKIAALRGQVLALCDAVEVVAQAAASLRSEIQAIKSRP